ncbi:hypothetical protein ABIE52_006896, partial [Rhodococcus sp. OAS809]
MTHQNATRPNGFEIQAKDMHDFSDEDPSSGSAPGSGPTGSPGSTSGLGAIMGGLLPGASTPDDPDDIAKSMLTDYNDKFVSALPAEFRDDVIDRAAAALIS